MGERASRYDLGIWGFAFGYFAAYVPYAALTKAVTSGLLPGMGGRGVDGFEILPVSTISSLVGMLGFITAMGWWKHAGHRRLFGASLPLPGKWTFLSGLCTAVIIGTTTLAYTFKESIIFMMLLLRGGVLVIAPIVDFICRRRVRWFSWLGLALSLSALFVAFAREWSFRLQLLASVDVAFYLAGYFVRLQIMSRLAKSDDEHARTRYFVEEQMVATPAIVTALIVAALVGHGEIMMSIRRGFTDFLASGHVLTVVLLGLCSQGTGVFGGLILLDKRENTFCVPVNRCSSIMAGVASSYALTLLAGQRGPDAYDLGGAALIVGAILVLTIPALRARRALAAPG